MVRSKDSQGSAIPSAKPRTRLDTDSALSAHIEDCIKVEKERLAREFGSDSEEYRVALQQTYRRHFQVNGMYWTEMVDKRRYRLPSEIQIHIMRFMRRHRIVTKVKKGRERRFMELYRELHVGETAAEELNTKFRQLCRNKIDNFIQAMGRKLKKHRVWEQKGSDIEFKAYTEEWERPDWEGDYLPMHDGQDLEDVLRSFSKIPKPERDGVMQVLKAYHSSTQELHPGIGRLSYDVGADSVHPEMLFGGSTSSDVSAGQPTNSDPDYPAFLAEHDSSPFELIPQPKKNDDFKFPPFPESPPQYHAYMPQHQSARTTTSLIP